MTTQLIYLQNLQTALQKQQKFQDVLKVKQMILADKWAETQALNVLFVDFNKKKQITRKEWLKQNN